MTAAEDDEVIGCARNASPHPVNRQCFTNRFMYRLASRGLTTPPWGVTHLLRILGLEKHSALCHAARQLSGSTSELYGYVREIPQPPPTTNGRGQFPRYWSALG
jgi:hypothetical protein